MSDAIENIREDLRLLGNYTMSCMPVARQIGFVQDVRVLLVEIEALRSELDVSQKAINSLQTVMGDFKSALRKCADHVGAFAGDQCSDKFVCEIADEVGLVVKAKDGEIERLRAALENISRMHADNQSLAMADMPRADYVESVLDSAKREAREALKGGAS